MSCYGKDVPKLRALAAAAGSIVEAPAGQKLAWRAVVDRLRGVSGFGGSGFVAKEVMHDAMGWPAFRALVVDDDSWTPTGPGARRGINRLHGRDKDLGVLAFTGAAEDRFARARVRGARRGARRGSLQVAELRLLLGAVRAADPAFCAAVKLDLHDVQFQLCEYDKYARGCVGMARYRPFRGAAARFPPGFADFRDDEWHVSCRK